MLTQQLMRGHGLSGATARPNVLPAPAVASTSYSSAPHQLAPTRWSQTRRSRPEVAVNAASGQPDPNDPDSLKNKYFSNNANVNGSANSSSSSSPQQQQQDASSSFSLDAVNPYVLGRQARAAFDDIWSNVSRLSSPTRSFVVDDVMEPGRDADFESPQAAYTTVLVVGATGRVGRILTRKLLLRGYKVKALVRNREGTAKEALPAAVEVIQGDVGDMDTCQKAVAGVNKVIYCAAARTTFTADLLRVDDRGVMNITKAMQDEYYRKSRSDKSKFSPKAKKELADFSQTYHQKRWDVTYVGSPEQDKQAMVGAFRNEYLNMATAEINVDDNLVFEGTLMQRGAIAEVGARINSTLPGGEHRTKDTEGLALRVRGDGHFYLCIVETEDGNRYGARFPTRAGYLTVRLPYTAFRSEFQGQPPLDAEKITGISIRYENRRQPGATAARAARGGVVVDDATFDQKFSLEIDWIKALPSGSEPDVVLVSCAGRSRPGVSAADLDKIISFKRRGEENVRLSGLGYSVIRPGTLVEEPGGYKALVFDQGDRITQPISAADVADICLRALHEPEARNKTFDVAYETSSKDGSSMFELVAHVPDKSNNYLRAAVQPLAKNT